MEEKASSRWSSLTRPKFRRRQDKQMMALAVILAPLVLDDTLRRQFLEVVSLVLRVL